MIADLIQNKGLGSAPAKLLFGGCSAGAIGAMNNLETVASLVPATVQVKGFLDGAGLLNMSPGAWTWSPELETLQQLSAGPFATRHSKVAVHRSSLPLSVRNRIHLNSRIADVYLFSSPAPAVATLLTFSNAQFPSYCQSLFPNDLWKCLIGQYRFAEMAAQQQHPSLTRVASLSRLLSPLQSLATARVHYR